jgi:hypothetical protein
MEQDVRALRRRWVSTQEGVVAAGLVVTGLVVASCQAAATPRVIYVTPLPTPIVIYVTPEPTTQVVDPTPTPQAEAAEPTPEPTPEPTAEPTAEVTPTPASTPTSPASFCTGSDDNRAFFAGAAKTVGFKVYCATGLPSGWAIASGTWAGSKTGGSLDVVYRFKSTSQRFELEEGSFCTTSKVDCMGGPSVPAPWLSGPYFDGRQGEVANLLAGGDWVIEVGAGTTRAYVMTGTNVDVDTLVGFAANMKAVPKA